jgi:Fic family protein
MHIEVRTVGKKKKHYLTHSAREGKKFKKFRAYLGADLSKSEIDTKRELAEQIILDKIKQSKEIHDPYNTVLSSGELTELKSLEAKGDIKIKHLTEDDWLKFSEAFTYDTNAIEGSSVTEGEVVNILENNAKPTNRKEWEIVETHGVAEAVQYIRKAEEHVSLELIKELHRISFNGSKGFAGQFRKKGEEVVVVNAFGEVIHRGTHSTKVVEQLKEIVEWYKQNKSKYTPIVLAAVIHNRFETIHPFADGNGRVGRLLLNNILLKHNKPPINIEFENRREYYLALQAYQKKGNVRPTIELIIKQYKELKRLFKKR